VIEHQITATIPVPVAKRLPLLPARFGVALPSHAPHADLTSNPRGSAIQSLLAEETPYEVALVSLDLAALYAQQGRTEEMKRLAAGMMPVFSSLQIHREALAALTFWKQAVEAETSHERISQLVAGVAAFLKRSRYDPELRFVAPA
jgi:hypothetical protein